MPTESGEVIPFPGSSTAPISRVADQRLADASAAAAAERDEQRAHLQATRGMWPLEPTRFLVDSSVWLRLGVPAVASSLSRIVAGSDPGDVLVCAPIVAEVGFNARSGDEHAMVMAQLRVFRDVPAAPDLALVTALQGEIWANELLRSVSAADTLVAAYAIENRLMLLHYDQQFEYVAAVTGRFEHRWIVPRGSI
jgi:predicted nucleic acid-binding protein